MLDYYLEQNRVPENSTEYHAIVTHSERSSQTDFVRILGKTLGGVTEGEAQRVLAAVSTAAQEQFMEGRPFSIEGLGTFALSIHGSFPGPDAPWDTAANKVGVSFRADKALSAAAGKTPLNRLHGVVHGPVIDSVIDAASSTVNQRLTSGHNIRLIGRGIKLAGEGAALSFMPAGGGAAVPVLPADISHNGPTEIVFICPAIQADTKGHLTLSTRYGSNSRQDGSLRSYMFPIELTAFG